jgi:hypothetical protein
MNLEPSFFLNADPIPDPDMHEVFNVQNKRVFFRSSIVCFSFLLKEVFSGFLDCYFLAFMQ